ncbi:hypothetical protein ABIF29_003559 [Bradyrhizobium elkanii]|uniref:Transposase n=1 Tax=Bradyrhizobium elkanii TaxID=29448 RepID=A0ABV4F021_BRAEL
MKFDDRQCSSTNSEKRLASLLAYGTPLVSRRPSAIGEKARNLEAEVRARTLLIEQMKLRHAISKPRSAPARC